MESQKSQKYTKSKISKNQNIRPLAVNVDRDFLQRLAKEENIHENMIVNKGTLTRSKVHKKEGVYTYPMWIKCPEESEGPAQKGESSKGYPAQYVGDDNPDGDDWFVF